MSEENIEEDGWKTRPKKKRKDAEFTTDGGRTILGKYGREEPRSAKGNWRLWVECQNASISSLYAWKEKREKQINETSEKYKRKKYERELEIIKGAISNYFKRRVDDKLSSEESIDVIYDYDEGEYKITYSDRTNQYVVIYYDENDNLVQDIKNVDEDIYYKTILIENPPEEEIKEPSKEEIYQEWEYWSEGDNEGISIGENDLINRQAEEEKSLRKKWKEEKEVKEKEGKKKKHREAQKQYRDRYGNL